MTAWPRDQHFGEGHFNFHLAVIGCKVPSTSLALPHFGSLEPSENMPGRVPGIFCLNSCDIVITSTFGFIEIAVKWEVSCKDKTKKGPVKLNLLVTTKVEGIGLFNLITNECLP
jgi:hypothetical protein